MGAEAMTPAQAQALLAAKGRDWWRSGNIAALDAASAVVPDELLAEWPDVARWRALASLMQERSDALSCLDRAHAGHLAAGDVRAAGIDAHMALVSCVIDVGAVGGVADWLQRADAVSFPTLSDSDEHGVWLHAGVVARSVLSGDVGADLSSCTGWLQDQLKPLRAVLAPNERLIVAQVLVNLYLLRKEFGKFDLLATAIEEPAAFGAALPLMRMRWLHTLGVAKYQIGNSGSAEDAWQRALNLVATNGLEHKSQMIALAMLRLLLDQGRLAEAQRLQQSIQPKWGAGRDLQLMDLKQMNARLQMLQGQPAQALATLNEALAVADEAQFGLALRASCHTDLAQLLIANQRTDEAVRLLEMLAREHSRRDAEIFRCILELLQAWLVARVDEEASRVLLRAGLQRGQNARYTMFFRLLPRLAAALCAMALRWQIEPSFVSEVVRSRNLPAPSDAGEHWPWWLHLRMLGGFEMRLRGELVQTKGKVQKKPIELLRVLACAGDRGLSTAAVADALWPDAEGDSASKNLEMTVQRLRRLLGDEDRSLVQVSDGRVGLDAGRVSSDLAEVRALIPRLEALALEPESGPACTRLAMRLEKLHRGPLLPGAPEAAWLSRERERCTRDAIRAAQSVRTASLRFDLSPGERAAMQAAVNEIGSR